MNSSATLVAGEEMMTTRSSLAVLALGFAGSAQAVIAYSTFGPGYAYKPNVAYVLGDHLRQEVAIPFVAAHGGRLDTITVAVRHYSGNAGLTFYLRTDNNAQVGDWFLMSSWQAPEDAPSVHTIVNPFPWLTLNAGERYWLHGSAPDGTSYMGWCHNSIGATGDYAYRWGDDAWNNVNGDLTAMEVTVEAVPEPATLLALGGALALLIRRRR